MTNQEIIDAAEAAKTAYHLGATSEQVWDLIKALAENDGGSPGGGYLVYTALLSQSGTDAPVATVLENTIGDIVWMRDDAGDYSGTLSSAFPLAKTLFFSTNMAVPFGISIYSREDGEPSSSIALQTFNTMTGVKADNLYFTTVEIRVYP